MAISVTLQWDGKRLHPYTEQDVCELSSLNKNQVIEFKGKKKRDMYRINMIRLYFAVCEEFRENYEYIKFQHVNDVHYWLKDKLQWIDHKRSFTDPFTNKFYPVFKSLSKEGGTSNKEMADYIQDAIELMAIILGVDQERLVEMTQENMRSY